MKEPLISVVIPVYNAEKHISQTIDSLFSQTNKDFEIIFVDDGSCDNSVALIEKKMKNFSVQWRVFRQNNRGQGEARNAGYSLAVGKWILFLDADDTLQSYAISHYSMICMQNPKADVIFSQYWNVSELDAMKCARETDSIQVVTQRELLFGFLTRKMPFLVPGTLYRADFLASNHLSHPAIPWSEDQYFMWLVLSNVRTAVISSTVIYNYVHHGGTSIMRSTSVERMLESYKAYDRFPEFVTEPTVKKYVVPRWCLGCLHVLAARSDKKSYNVFWKDVAFDLKCRTLLTFPSFKIRVLAFSGFISKGLLYQLMRRL